MTTYERIISELGDGLGIDLAPDGSGVAEVCAEDRMVLLRADETGERELTAFTVAATAPEEGFPPATLERALAMNLFGREVAGLHLGLFADTLILSDALPLENLSVETLAERIVMLSRLAGTLSGTLASPAPAASPAEGGGAFLGEGFIAM